jgi:hypothetical protein
MATWPVDERGICAVLTAVAGVLLVLRLGPRASRAAWLVVLAAGLANAVTLNLHQSNLININLVHHYLGAKYPFPYDSCYRLINAALERPQVVMRNLERPPAMLRVDVRSQRAYYIDLMRHEGVAFEPLAPLPDLRELAVESGAIAAESQRILSEYLPAEHIEDFRRDTRVAVEALTGRDITTDYGFNGSPFYAAVRHLDPTLHMSFGAATAYFNMIVQIAAVFLLAWIAGAALALGANERLAAAALLFASWDFVGWAMPGLVFAGMWLPVAAALLFFRRGRAAPAGGAVAWAGLIKLFPFALALPAASRLGRAVIRRGGDVRENTVPRWALGTLAWCAAAVVVLGVAAMLGGRSWADFLHKIAVQFQSKAYLLNSVSLSQWLFTFGIHNSTLPPVLSLLSLAALVAMFAKGASSDFAASLPRRSLVLLAATGWVAHTWFNYYAIAPLLLLPLIAQRNRIGAATAALGMAAAFALPEFDDPVLLARPALHALKVAPYVLIPAWLVVAELRRMEWSTTARRVALVVVSLAVVATAGEALRMRAIDRLDKAAGEYLDRGDAQSALDRYRKLVTLAPRNAMAHMNEAIALATAGQLDQAGAGFARAVELAPGSPVTRQNYGRWLLQAGKYAEAEEQLGAARNLSPADDRVLLYLSRALLEQNRRTEAAALLTRALELNPANRAVQNLLLDIDRR